MRISKTLLTDLFAKTEQLIFLSEDKKLQEIRKASQTSVSVFLHAMYSIFALVSQKACKSIAIKEVLRNGVLFANCIGSFVPMLFYIAFLTNGMHL